MKKLCDDVLVTPAVHTLQKTTADYHFEIARNDLSYGKYVAVLVDLSRKKRKIVSDFKDYLEGMVRTCTTDANYWEETRGKEKDFQYSIWTVYDLCSQKRKPNFTEVARILSGKSGQARDSAQLRASLKAVKRAYKNACEIMKKVVDV
ncbi:MAG: hypothetical protein HY939_03740 [Gammaproteobacteria bacterium]|nr:hypothetical protein [Gammaproteobacteria bacterium]